MLCYPESGVKVLEAATANRGLDIVALFGNHAMNTEFMKCTLMMGRKASLTMRACVRLVVAFIWEIAQELHASRAQLIQNGSVLSVCFPSDLLLHKVLCTSSADPGFPGSAVA